MNAWLFKNAREQFQDVAQIFKCSHPVLTSHSSALFRQPQEVHCIPFFTCQEASLSRPDCAMSAFLGWIRDSRNVELEPQHH